eukprot:scaffold1237_cov403-Prasinococcus_capsulatus_cf.AAC.6
MQVASANLVAYGSNRPLIIDWPYIGLLRGLEGEQRHLERAGWFNESRYAEDQQHCAAMRLKTEHRRKQRHSRAPADPPISTFYSRRKAPEKLEFLGRTDTILTVTSSEVLQEDLHAEFGTAGALLAGQTRPSHDSRIRRALH